MASIFQRGKQGIWWIKYYVNGRQVYHSLRTTSARTAKQIERQIEGDKAKGELIGPSKTPLPEFLEDYCRFLSTQRTPESYSNDISVLRIAFGPITPVLEPGNCVNKRFRAVEKGKLERRVKAPCMGATHLEDVTAAKTEDFISRRIRDDGISPKTANRCREVLRSMFACAVKKWNFVSADHRYPNPAGAVQRRKEPARTIRFLALDDIENACHPRLCSVSTEASSLFTVGRAPSHGARRFERRGRSRAVWASSIHTKTRLFFTLADHMGEIPGVV